MYALPSSTALPLARPDRSSPERIEHAARELETQFAHMMIKSMRSASLGDPAGSAEGTYRDMYDQQLAREITKGPGLGLAPMIRRQLEQSAGGAQPLPATPAGGLPLHGTHAGHLPLPAATPAPTTLAGGTTLALAPTRNGNALQAIAPPPLPAMHRSAPARASQAYASISPAAGTAAPATQCDAGDVDCSSPEAFVRSIWPHARRTAEQLGVPTRAVVAQAALETGWGRHIAGDQAGSNNLFGIKATGWDGARVSSGTHEYANGAMHREQASFRAYDSVADSFSDYARLLHNPRYSAVRAAGGDVGRFADALQRAGYATDPAYADKIRTIANSQTMQRALASLPVHTRG